MYSARHWGPALLIVLSSPAIPALCGEAARRVETFPPERVQVEGDPPERVHLSVSVLDPQGEPVLGLKASDFLVYEGDVRQELVDFGPELERRDRPLSAVLLVDRSGSVRRQMGKWREAGAALASTLRPFDEVRLSTFATEVRVVRDFTHDAGRITAAVDRLDEAGGGTRVFAAVDETLADLATRRGRKVIFLLTDGLDNIYGDAWNMSANAYLRDLVRRAVQGEVTVITIVPGPTGLPFLAAQDLAIQTGGWWLYPSDDLPRLVARLGERLLGSYYLAYDSTRAPTDIRRRTLRVELTRPSPARNVVRTVEAVYGATPLFDLIAERLSSSVESERAGAAADLAMVVDRRRDAAALLLRLLKDDSALVRAAAARALGTMPDTPAVKQLSRLLGDREAPVRAAAAEALGSLLESSGDPAVRERILDALEDIDGN